eukprot:293724_1
MSLYNQMLNTHDTAQIEGNIENAVDVDLSKFQVVIAALNSLQMYQTYFSVFKANNVNDQAVLCLEKDDIKDLIHKIGDRALFIKWLNEYKKTNNNINIKKQNNTLSKICSTCNGNQQIKQTEEYKENEECKNCNGNGSVSMSKSRPTQTQCTYCDPPGSGKSLKHSECWGMNSMNAGPNGVPWWGTVTANHTKIYGPNGAEGCSYCIAGSPNCSVCKGTALQTKQEYYAETIVCNSCSGAKIKSKTKYKDIWVQCTACKGSGVEI